jgi:organic hydroperoxide reductase OsmC/OhrA
MSDVVTAFDITLTQQDGFLFEAVFDNPNHDPVFLDEPAPLGKDEAPNAARMLAAAIGNCLSASLVFCLQKNGAKVPVGVTTRVHVEIVRNEHKRLRIGKVRVDLHTPPGIDAAAMQKCLPAFEDFCTVTASIREGIDVDVKVEQG